jgi:hypothetical protein
MPLVIAATVVVALLLVIIVILLSRGSTPVTVQNNSGGGAPGVVTNGGVASANNSKLPSFCGTTLDGNTTIYLLDCGSATKDFLGSLKDATVKSIESLGSDRKFQILFWNNGTDGAYPQDAPTYATRENIAAAQKAIDDISAFGQSDVKTSLHPDTLIIATGKGWDLDNAWLDGVLAIRGSSPVKINTYSLGSNGESAPLKKLAAKTGGSYHEVSEGELHDFGQ